MKLEHMSQEHQRYLAYNADDFNRWAMTVGSMTEKAVAFFLESGKTPEQGYKACASFKRLQERYGSKRLEMACERVMAYGATPSIRNISSLLKHGQEPANTTPHTTPGYNSYGITRGAAYYSKGGVKK